MAQTRIGILGGGQLGRMLTQAAKDLNISVTVLDPTPNCPASQVGAEHILGSFTDAALITELAKKCDVITVEIEHVNADAVAEAQRASGGLVRVEPSPSTVALIQDKFLQKELMGRNGVPVGDFRAVETQDDVLALAKDFGYPLMLKSRRLAYDGRGNAVVQSAEGVAAAWAQLAPKGGLYAEKWVPFRRELAVIVARGADGSCVGYDAVETIQKNNICHVVVAPAQVPGDVLARAREVAQRAVSHFTGAGVYGVELFELADGAILLNEMAPRVHNSGHHTIEACHTSQFEQHIRAVAGLPLGDPSMRVGAAVMVNVLGTGAAPEDAQRTWAICQRALATPGASVHWYGKAGTTLGRKVGHVTVTGQWMPDVLRKALAIAEGGAATGATVAAAQGPAPVPSWVAARAPLVGIIMGSDSDLPVMEAAASTLRDFGVPFELTVVSAHRTPKRLFDYATTARARGLKVIIAAAGGAAHLPGMVAAMTPLPVIGVPVPLKHLDGVDSLYSIVQMPRGVPVATVAIGNSTNAALLAARILGSFVGSVGDAMEAYQRKIEGEVLDKVSTLERVGWEQYGKQPGGAHK